MRIFLILGFIAVMFSAFAARAQSGDIDAGKAKSAVCAACHGVDGNAIGEFPNLAGQVSGYIAAQLAAFQSGARTEPIMAGMAAALSARDMADLDAYYNAQTPKVAAISADDEAAARAGEKLYRAGDAEFATPACMACHGPAGHGVAPNFPRLAGQPAAYIKSQLHKYKNAERAHPMMSKIAHPLTAAQIEQLAIYLSGLN